MPAFQAARTLPRSIESIRRSAPPRSEVVVVDDGSLDDTAEIATRLADRVVCRPCQGGAARARNDGAQLARGDVLFFVDADVTVTAAAVAGALRHLEDGADAVYGAYEPLPPTEVRNTATDYKNLLHHYTHLTGVGDAQTFWSGFGAVRREAFIAVGGFDPAVTTGADVEDIHLGFRLRAAGFRIVRDASLQVLHYKRYDVRSLISSDVFHRAIPWTRAMFELRTFSSDLNLRQRHMLAAAVSVGTLVAPFTFAWIGLAAFALSAGLVATWLALHWEFLSFVRRILGRGVVRCAGLLYLYYFYGIAGTLMGAAAVLLRHGHTPAFNRLRLDTARERPPDVAVTVAVIVKPGEPLSALEGLPPPAPWWQLIVVAAGEASAVPPWAELVPAPIDASTNEMRQMALERARGEMFATLDARCLPVAGWLDRVRLASEGPHLVVAGAFAHERSTVRRRAEQVVRYWQWRPERPPCWVVHHPNTNAAFRTAVARELGGFRVEGALILRLAAFGARPVRFDPAMAVRLTGATNVGQFLRGVAGVSRLRASASVRYFDIGLLHRATLVAVSPLSGLRHLTSIVSAAVKERTADKSFWLALPLTATGVTCHWLGRDMGLLRPRLRGGLVPRSASDLPAIQHELSVTRSGR